MGKHAGRVREPSTKFTAAYNLPSNLIAFVLIFYLSPLTSVLTILASLEELDAPLMFPL